MKQGKPTQAFNCVLENAHTYVTVGGTFNTTSLLDRRKCTFQAIRNSENIIAGTELLIQIPAPKKEDDKEGGGDPDAKRQKLDPSI